MLNFEEQFKKLLQEYDAKLSIPNPNWFVSGIKTLLDRNITIEDWNRTYSYLEALVSDDVVLLKLLKLLKSEVSTLETNKADRSYVGEIASALEENQDVVDVLNKSVANKADKSYVDDLYGKLNLYDYVVYNNPEVVDDTLYLENGYVRDGVLYLKNAKVENGVLYIDYIE